MFDKPRWSVSGQAKVEYILLIGLVSLVVVAALILLGTQVADMIKTIEDELEDATPTLAPTPLPTFTPPPSLKPTPTPKSARRLLYSDFEDGSALEWYETRGNEWRVEEGTYCGGPRGEHRSFTGDEDWTNYVIELQADLHKGKGFGIYFRATDPDHVNAYCFQYNPGYGRGAFLFRKVVNGREKHPPLVTRWIPKDYDWYAGPRHIRLEVVGNTYTAFVDGVRVAQLVDDSYPHGAVGLRIWHTSEACFDNITVTTIE